MAADTRRPAVKIGGLLHTVHEQAHGNEKTMASMFTIAAAASKFKRGAATSQQVSREKRELLKKVEGDMKYKQSTQRLRQHLEDLMMPYIESAVEAKKNAKLERMDSDKSDAESVLSDNWVGGEERGPAEVLAEMKGILEAFADESMQICCDKWEVDKFARRLKASNDHLSAAEKQNREAHHNFMQELTSTKTQLRQAQNRPTNADVKISASDVVFYEATEYLCEEQRNLVKEMVEYKVRSELARGTPLEDLADGNQALRKKLQEHEEKMKELEEKLGDSQTMVKNMRADAEERSRADIERQKEFRNQNANTPDHHGKPWDRSVQTDPVVFESKEAVVDAVVKETCDASTDVTTGPALFQTADASVQAELEQKNGAVVYKDVAKPDMAAAQVQTDAEPLDPMIEQQRLAAEEAEKAHRELKEAMQQLQSDNMSITAELETTKMTLKASQEAGGPVKIVEVPRSRPPSEMKAIQCDILVAAAVTYTGPSDEEQALELAARDEKIKELEEEVKNQNEVNEQLRKDTEAQKLELEGLRSSSKTEAPKPARSGPSQEEFEKLDKQAQKLRTENRKLGEDLEHQKEMNTKLEIAINELREKMKALGEQLRSAGMGHIADRMFDSSGLAEILSNKPLSVFDRLYNDALKRTRRTGGVKGGKEAQALLSTVQHINRAGQPPPQPRGNFQSMAIPPSYEVNAAPDAGNPPQYSGDPYPSGYFCQNCQQPLAPMGSMPAEPPFEARQRVLQGVPGRPMMPQQQQHTAFGSDPGNPFTVTGLSGAGTSTVRPMMPQQQHTAFVSNPGNPFVVTSLSGTSTGTVVPQTVGQAQQQRAQPEHPTRTWHDSFTPTPSLVVGQNSPPPQNPLLAQTLKTGSPSLSPLHHVAPTHAEMAADETLQGESCAPQKQAAEIKIIIGSRVRATEKLQFKIGARVVQVPENSQGSVVQLYPNLGVDWDSLPSVDKIFVQPDMVEALPPVESSHGQDKQPVYMETFKRDPDPGLSPGTRLPQVSPVFPQLAATLPPMPSAGLASLLGKSTSSPALTSPPVSRHLPRLDSPAPLRGRAHGTEGKSQINLDSLPAGATFTGGSATRPLSMSSNALYFKQQQSPASPADEMSRSTGQLRTAKTGVRTSSSPPPKFFVRGEMCEG